MKEYSLILLAGGSGERMNNSIPKQFMFLAGKPIIMHTMDRIDQIKQIKQIIIVCKEEFRSVVKEYIKEYKLMNHYIFADAGNIRQESVYNGLLMADCENVIIHEAARPFVKSNEFYQLIREEENNVIFANAINFTVLKGADKVEGLLERDELINVQLPQKFLKSDLLKAHEKARKENRRFTEDAGLLFNYERKDIKILKGTSYNIKITEPVDIIIGEQIYKDYILNRD